MKEDVEEYRDACKRCYIYLKKNKSEEDDEYETEELADYYKGEAMIILEEFTLALNEVPKIDKHIVSGIGYLLSKLSNCVE
jgi:hypothetical protein